jgi:TetR/AcrR family transcriptional regulator, transcriptional repressor of aconitase
VRRRQIIEAAVRCFARSGIHPTTLQDVFAEAGLSAGAVYRYFPSKQSLVLAIAERVSDQLAALVDDDGRAPVSVVDETLRLIRAFDVVESDPDRRRVAVAVWNESLYDAAVGEVIVGIVGRVTAALADRLRALQRTGGLASDVDATAAARVLVALLPGYVLQRSWFPELDADIFAVAAARLMSGADDGTGSSSSTRPLTLLSERRRK